MKTSISLRARVFLALLVAYLVFVPTGPYPLYVAGFRLEYILFYLVCGISLLLLGPVFRKLTGNYGGAQVCVLGYLIIIGLTTLLSSQTDVSNRAFLTTLGYAYLTCVIPPLTYRHINFVRQSLLWLAGATALFFIYLHLTQGYGGEQRFTLADTAARSESDVNYVDPNMTAIGMVMCVIIALPILLGTHRRDGWAKRTINRVTAVVVIGSAIFFESRTAAVSFILGVAFAFTRAASGRGRNKKIAARAALLFSMLLVAVFLNRNGVNALADRLSGFELDTTGANGRINLYIEALQDWTTSAKTVVFGNGYYVSNPHNEFLRSLTCDGLVGFTAFVVLMLGVYAVSCRGRQYNADQMLSQNMLFGFIVSAMMTYGHTKTMWLAYAFLLTGYLETQIRGPVSRTVAVSQVGEFSARSAESIARAVRTNRSL